MRVSTTRRYWLIAVVLVLGVFWSLSSAEQEGVPDDYPNPILISAAWLDKHKADPALVIVDVREDKYLNGKFIPGAVRLPWKLFRAPDTARGVDDLFIGTDRAQDVLGEHGISRGDTVVLYDVVERDGGATASYVFWVLEVLGHQNMKVLERGIDAWIDAGFPLEQNPREPEPVLYQAPLDELRLERWVSGDFIQKRLGDPYYQILDVRSRAEYVGDKLNKGLGGAPLKPGHIPTAYNVEYKLAWDDNATKTMKTYEELQDLFGGLDPDKTVVTYCHSGRRASFGYFTLRLMGFPNVANFDGSWYEWGNPRFYYPTELEENPLSGDRPGQGKEAGSSLTASRAGTTSQQQKAQSAEDAGSGGYVSCGG